MANVIHKTTLQFKKSVNTADYLDGNWIINPDMDVIKTVDKRFWKLDGDDVVEMEQAEKDVIIDDELHVKMSYQIHKLWEACNDFQSQFFTTPVFTKMDKLGRDGDRRVADVEEWIDDLWTDYYTRRYMIAHVTDEESMREVSLDFTNNGTPPYTVAQLLNVTL